MISQITYFCFQKAPSIGALKKQYFYQQQENQASAEMQTKEKNYIRELVQEVGQL